MSQTIGHGSKLKIGDGATSENFTEITGVSDIAFGSDKVDSLDTTTLGSSGNNRSFIGGLHDPGEVTAKINVLPGDTTQALLFTAEDAELHNFKVIYPAATRTRSFAAIVVSLDESITYDKLPTYTVKLKISGVITNS
jgi:predicted secreted protein